MSPSTGAPSWPHALRGGPPPRDWVLTMSLDPISFTRTAVDPERLAVLGALAIQSRTQQELRDVTGLEPRRLGRAVARLQAAGLLAERDGMLCLVHSVLRGLAAGLARAAPPDPTMLVNLSAADAQGISPFFSGRELLEIPASPARRTILLRILIDGFESGRRYTEAEVRWILRRFHPDDAALRRYPVDAGLLGRDNRSATYWRAEDQVLPGPRESA